MVAAPLEDIDPASLGLTLTGVALGSRRSTATINGKAYREGETIKVNAQGKDATPLTFRLARVERYGVVLERGGKWWQIALPRPALSGDEVIRGSTD